MCSGWTSSRSRATSRRRRLFVAAAIVPGSMLTMHGVGLNPRRTGSRRPRAHGRPISVYNRRRSAVSRPGRGDACVRARGRDRLARRGAVADRRAAAPRARRLSCARRDRRRGAAELRVKETDRIAGVVEELRRIGVTSGQPATASASRACPTPRRCRRACAATIGSRCSARSPACPRAKASSSWRRCGRGELSWVSSRFSSRSPPARLTTLRRHDRRHRRTSRIREEHRRVARRASRLPVPRHGCDVPRTHLARAAGRSGARGRPCARGAGARPRGLVFGRRQGRRRRRGRVLGDQGRGDRPSRARGGAAPGGASRHARAPAPARCDGRRRHRRARYRERRGTSGGEGLPRRRRVRARTPPRRSDPEPIWRSPPICASETSETPRTRSPQPTQCSSTRPRSPSTRWSSESSSSWGAAVNRTDVIWAVGRVTIGTAVKAAALRVYGPSGCRRPAAWSWRRTTSAGSTRPPSARCARTLYYMAKVEAHRVPGLGELMRAFGAFSVRRGESDRDAVRTMRQIVRTARARAVRRGHPAAFRRAGPVQPGAAMVPSTRASP